MKGIRGLAVHVGFINWRMGKLRKLCGECGEPMRLTLDESGIVMDSLPPLYGFDWKCENGHTENAGAMSDDHADELRRIFEG